MSGTHRFRGCNSADSVGQQRAQPSSPNGTFLGLAHPVAPKGDEARDCRGGKGLMHGLVRLTTSICMLRRASFAANHPPRLQLSTRQRHNQTNPSVGPRRLDQRSLETPGQTRCCCLHPHPEPTNPPHQTQTKPHISFSFEDPTTFKKPHLGSEADLYCGNTKP